MASAKESKDEQATAGSSGADSRFAAVGTDPRFRRFPTKQNKVKIDERFAGMFKDAAFESHGIRDKRGRKVQGKGKTSDLKSYYRLGDAEDEEEKTVGEASGALSDSEAAKAEERWAKMRGLGDASSSSSEDESESESGSDSQGAEGVDLGDDASVGEEDEEDEEEERRAERVLGIGAMAVNPREQIPLVPDATARVAVLDLDWDHLRAVDILVVLRSFAPPRGAVRRVTVYPSDYGLERMAEEATAGPQGIWEGVGEEDGEAAEDGESDGVDADVERRRLRAYELSKLRYYYAVVECDGPATASRLYEECDGMEFLKTACKFDLRFVPEEQSFEGRTVRDSADDVPDDYAPPVFQNKALQHTSVDLTWDAVDSGRKQTLSRKVTAEEIREDDFKAYLASSSDEEEEAEVGAEPAAEAVRERYRQLLALGTEAGSGDSKKGGKEWGKGEGSDSDEDEDGGAAAVRDRAMELEVTFHPGLEGLSERLAAKQSAGKKGGAESVWDAYMRRRAEKRAAARRLGKHNVGSSDEDSDGDPVLGSGSEGEEEGLPAGVADDPFFQREEGEDPFADPFFDAGPGGDAGSRAAPPARMAKGKKARKGEGGPTAAERAELEMLLMDEDEMLLKKQRAEAAAALPSAKVSRKERLRLKKAARRAERTQGSDDEDFVLAGKQVAGAEDPRFSSMVTSSLFALDPTDPRYTGESAALAKKVASLRKGAAPAPVAAPAAPSQASALHAIVDSLKRKARNGPQAQKKAKGTGR